MLCVTQQAREGTLISMKNTYKSDFNDPNGKTVIDQIMDSGKHLTSGGLSRQNNDRQGYIFPCQKYFLLYEK